MSTYVVKWCAVASEQFPDRAWLAHTVVVVHNWCVTLWTKLGTQSTRD